MNGQLIARAAAVLAALAVTATPAAGATLRAGGPVDLASEFDARIDGALANSSAGWAVAPAGDVNGDGPDDVVIGARDANAAFVVFGAASFGNLDLAALGTRGIAITGVTGGLGAAVAGAGDVNDDGFADVIVGADDVAADAGAAYVIYGSAAPAAAVNVSSLAPATTGFRIAGAAAGDDAGVAVAGIGDVNSDGFADVAVGSEQIAGGSGTTGRVDVVFGRAGASAAHVDLASLGAAGVTRAGVAAGDRAGRALAGGDVTGDGAPDLIVGAPGADNNGRSVSGSAYVLGTAALGTSGTLAAAVARIDGAGASDQLGSAVGAGDVDGDGDDDVIAGAPVATGINGGGAGRAYVVFGGAGLGTIDLAAAFSGILIEGQATSDNAGGAVASAGDVNGDGRDDVAIGAVSADNMGRSNSGSAYVVYGRAGSGMVDLAALAGDGVRLDGASSGNSAGTAVAGAGDVNDDSRADLIVGSIGDDNNGRPGSGSAYVQFGHSVSTVAYPATTLPGGRDVRLVPSITALGSASFSASGLPPGLAIDPATGVITGRPTAAGSFPATVTLTDATGPTSVAVALVVASGLSYPATGLTVARAASLVPVVAARDPASFGAIGLPAGLVIDPATGVIGGTPATVGSFPVTVILTDANGATAAATVLTIAPAGSAAPPAARDLACARRVPAFRPSAGRGEVTLSRSQLRVGQRIGQAAIRRLDAIERWIAAGIEGRDLCGHGISADDLDARVLAIGGGGPVAATPADPRPLALAPPRGGRPGTIALTRRQLMVNQRILQIALMRARMLRARLHGNLTGGDLAAGAITAAKLAPGTVIAAAPAPGDPAERSRTTPVRPRQGAGRPVRLTVSQLRINQRIAQAAVTQTNALRVLIATGLSGAHFKDGTIPARAIAPGAIAPLGSP